MSYVVCLLFFSFIAYSIYATWSVRHHGTYKAVEHEDGTYTLYYNYRGEWLEDGKYENYDSLLDSICKRDSNKLSVPTTPV